MTTLPDFALERIEELPFGLTPLSALETNKKYNPKLYNWLMRGDSSKENQEMFLKAYWSKPVIPKYYAKLKTNDVVPPTYLNKKLETGEFLLSTKAEIDGYQTLFTVDELNDILGSDINSYELIQEEPSHVDNNKYRFDEDGYDKYGYDRDDYAKDRYNKNGYDRDGYDMFGYDRSGYNKDGFDINGYDKDGYDGYGYDLHGFNRYGYDKYGYDSDNYNRNGYDEYGCDEDGYNRDGYDMFGYDIFGYDEDGYDEEGNAREE